MCKGIMKILAMADTYTDKLDGYLKDGMTVEEAEKKARNYMDWSFK